MGTELIQTGFSGRKTLPFVQRIAFGPCFLKIGLVVIYASLGIAEEIRKSAAPTQGGANPSQISEVSHWQLDAEEARSVIQALRKENEKLLQEKLDLEKRITTVRASLVLAQTEMDRLRAEKDNGGLGKPVVLIGDSGPSLYEGQVVDVNLDLQLVILNLGRNQGLQHGMIFTRTRDGIPRGLVRVLDVRNDIAGAVIEENLEGDLPRRGDRLLLRKETE